MDGAGLFLYLAPAIALRCPTPIFRKKYSRTTDFDRLRWNSHGYSAKNAGKNLPLLRPQKSQMMSRVSGMNLQNRLPRDATERRVRCKGCRVSIIRSTLR